MAVAEVGSANITLPSIHLGSFPPYPSMTSDTRRTSRFVDPNAILARDDVYPQQRPQWRSGTAPFPSAKQSSYRSYSPARQTYSTTPVSSRMVSPSNAYYSTAAQTPTIPIQPPNSPAQVPGPPKELCLECMMRDEDMADVDVTSPGVWDRESDVWFHELCQREEEEERERDLNPHPSTSSGVSSSMDCVRPRARGSKLTEGNLAVWLTLNPPEPAAKQQTLHTYLDAQNALLMAENRARVQAIQEARQLERKMRDAYSELRRSGYDLGPSASPIDEAGIKIRSPSSNVFGDDQRYAHHKRDTTLLENGMIVERVDVRKEDARARKEERRARKASRDSLGFLGERDTMSLYSLQAAEGTPSLRSPAPYESTMSVPLPTNRSVRSMYTTPSTSWQQPTNRPFSMAVTSNPEFASQTSLVSTGSPRRFFSGMRKWSGYFGSSPSLAPTFGSMVDMHLGLDQEKQLLHSPPAELPHARSPSHREAWSRVEEHEISRQSLDDVPTTNSFKKKKRGLSKLWKIFTGPAKPVTATCTNNQPHEVVDDLPLAPPPPLSYLVNRGSMQGERSINMLASGGRHLSMPSLTLSNGAHHPRSNSVRSAVGVGLSSPSDQSSILPSPTEIRFPPKDHNGEVPEVAGCDDDDLIGKKRSMGLDVPSSFCPSPPPMKRHPSSSPLVPTMKFMSAPAPRPISILSLDKNLPPLPPEEPDTAPVDSDQLRNHPVHATTLPVPQRANPGYRYADATRRQSFHGLASQPTLPVGAGRASIPGMAYNEFGVSRHSVTNFGLIPPTTTRRKSRFGLSSLFGRKDKSDHLQTTLSERPQSSYDPSVQPSTSPLSSRSFSQAGSSATRRPLEDFIQQEPDFVAYRYPSKDQRLDLSRV